MTGSLDKIAITLLVLSSTEKYSNFYIYVRFVPYQYFNNKKEIYLKIVLKLYNYTKYNRIHYLILNFTGSIFA